MSVYIVRGRICLAYVLRAFVMIMVFDSAFPCLSLLLHLYPTTRYLVQILKYPPQISRRFVPVLCFVLFSIFVLVVLVDFCRYCKYILTISPDLKRQDDGFEKVMVVRHHIWNCSSQARFRIPCSKCFGIMVEARCRPNMALCQSNDPAAQAHNWTL